MTLLKEFNDIPMYPLRCHWNIILRKVVVYSGSGLMGKPGGEVKLMNELSNKILGLQTNAKFQEYRVLRIMDNDGSQEGSQIQTYILIFFFFLTLNRRRKFLFQYRLLHNQYNWSEFSCLLADAHGVLKHYLLQFSGSRVQIWWLGCCRSVSTGILLPSV